MFNHPHVYIFHHANILIACDKDRRLIAVAIVAQKEHSESPTLSIQFAGEEIPDFHGKKKGIKSNV